MSGKKYYVVWKGKIPGIYEDWKECEKQVRGFEGAVYKSFTSLDEARKAYEGNAKDYFNKKKSIPETGGPDLESFSVDAACSGNPGVMEYRGVDTKSGIELFRKGPFQTGTNNIGEFLGIVHALAYLKKRDSKIPVYTDSRTAIKWVKNKAVKTKLPRNKDTEYLFELIDRAILWLNQNDYPNEIIKWDTENWGEIPADFGRK
jgi:ribonuclease HI